MKYGVKKATVLLKKNVFEYFYLLIGTAIMGLATAQFLLPNQLSSGGFAGVATIAYYLLKIPMGTTILLLNVPLLLLTYIKIGKEVFYKALVGSIFLSVFIDLFDKFQAITMDRFLGCIYGGILMGIGTAIVLKVKGSTGGSDLVSYVVKEYKPQFRSGSIIVIMDIIIVFLNVIFFKEIEIGLYSAITIYLMGKMIDIVFEGIYFTKLVFIVSDQNVQIAEAIGNALRRGTTGLYGKGMYSGKERMTLMCAASRRDVIRIREIAKQIDPTSFTIISNAREVFGKGFKAS